MGIIGTMPDSEEEEDSNSKDSLDDPIETNAFANKHKHKIDDIGTKQHGINLPVKDITDDWMDGEIIGTMEDEDEYIEEAEHENVVDIIKEPIMEIHTSFKDIETHMCKGQTDVVNSNMKKNTKETDENIETIGATDSAVKFTEQINSTKNIIKNIETEHHGFNLPVNEVTDDWMNDDLFGTFDKNSENEWLKEKD